MATLTIKVDKPVLFTIPKLDQRQLQQLGGKMVEVLNRRVASFRNVLDQPAKPYSKRGPIYIPVSGVGTIFRGPTGANKGAVSKKLLRANLSPDKIKLFTERRNKTTLGGREIFTKQDVAKLKAAGVLGTHATALGSVTPSGKSIKFANYAAYKKALGKSGSRDLELSGRMLGALAIVEMTVDSVTIGFTRALEELKAQGNQARDPWFGLSGSDRYYLFAFVNGL